MGKKNDEQQCLNIVLNHQPFFSYGKEIQKLLKSEIRQDEKPDFIINSINIDSIDIDLIDLEHDVKLIGIEHFLTDVIFEKKNSKNMSIERESNKILSERRDYYRNHQNELYIDIKSGQALTYAEGLMNKNLNGINKFSYCEFIQNFKLVYLKHYYKRFVYKEKCDTLGFLIEIPYPQFINRNGYIIENNGHKHYQSIKTIPLPRELLEFISEHNDIDFVILCIRPLFECKKKFKKTQIIYINPKNCNIANQNIVLCDSFDYPIKYIEENPIKLSY